MSMAQMTNLPFFFEKNIILEDEVISIIDTYTGMKPGWHLQHMSVALGDHENFVVRPPSRRFPELEERILTRYPGFRIAGAHFFGGSKDNAEYSGWHTGINITKTFKGNPDLRTIWIPLCNLNSETGGRLWFYNGPFANQLDDVMRICDKRSSVQHNILAAMHSELEQHKVTADIEVGDALVFRETTPHMVDGDSSGKRYVLSIRIVEEDAELDDEYLAHCEKFAELAPEIGLYMMNQEQKRTDSDELISEETKHFLGEMASLGVTPGELFDAVSLIPAMRACMHFFNPDDVTPIPESSALHKFFFRF